MAKAYYLTDPETGEVRRYSNLSDYNKAVNIAKRYGDKTQLEKERYLQSSNYAKRSEAKQSVEREQVSEYSKNIKEQQQRNAIYTSENVGYVQEPSGQITPALGRAKEIYLESQRQEYQKQLRSEIPQGYAYSREDTYKPTIEQTRFGQKPSSTPVYLKQEREFVGPPTREQYDYSMGYEFVGPPTRIEQNLQRQNELTDVYYTKQNQPKMSSFGLKVNNKLNQLNYGYYQPAIQSIQTSREFFIESSPIVKNIKPVKNLAYVESGFLKYYEQHPIKAGATAVVGLAFGAGTTYLSSIGPKTASFVEVGGVGLGGSYFTSKGIEYMSKPKGKERYEFVGETLAEATTFSLGAYGGGKGLTSVGFKPKPSYMYQLKFNQVELTQGDKTLNVYMGVGVFQPATGKNFDLIGFGSKSRTVNVKSEWGWHKVKQTSSEFDMLPFNVPNKKGISFGTPTVNFADVKYSSSDFTIGSLASPTTKNIINKADQFGNVKTASRLPKSKSYLKSVAKDEKQYFSLVNAQAKQTYYVKSKVYNIAEKPESFATESGFNYFINKLGKARTFIGTKASDLYGSVVYKTMVNKQIRPSGDVDVMFYKTPKQTEKFAKTESNILRFNYKDFAFWKKNEPNLIQTNVGGKQHKGDIHPAGIGSSEGEAPESFFGVPYDTRLYNIKTKGKSKARGYGLAFGQLGKASSIATPRIVKGKVYFAPEPHRMKDFNDFVVYNEQLNKEAGLSNKHLDQLKGTFKDKSIFESKLPEPKSQKPSLPRSPLTSYIPKSASIFSRSRSRSFSPSISRSLSPSVSRSLSPSVSRSPSPSISPSFSISRSLSPSVSRSLSPSISRSPSPSVSRSPSPSVSRSPSPSRSPSVSITRSPSPPKSPPIKFNIDVPKSIFGKKSKNPLKQKTKYNPSLIARELNIKGKKSKADILGVGIQPL